MVSTSRLEMEKFNGTKFELRKLKMADLLVYQDLWVAVFGEKNVRMKDEEWVVLKRKARSLIRLYLVLLNVSKEILQLSRRSWGFCIKLNPLLIKFFLRKQLFSLKMGDGDSIAEHLNASNIILTQLILVGVKMYEEDQV
jgi:hypothetical protein